jgi:hypothetical protein
LRVGSNDGVTDERRRNTSGRAMIKKDAHQRAWVLEQRLW